MGISNNNVNNKKVELKVGDVFVQSWKGCTKPMYFYVLNINREKNELKVKYKSFEGYTHDEIWNDLDITEIAFETGEYTLIK